MNDVAEQNGVAGDPEVVKKLGLGKRRSRKWLPRLVVGVAVAALGSGVWYWRAKLATPKAPSYVTAPVERGDLRETVTATGTLSPVDAVEVGAEVTGRVTKVTVDINDRVTQDQVLVEIDTEQLMARLEESQAQLQSAQASQRNSSATVKEAESKAARAREMHARGLISDQDLETAQATLDRAKASVSTSSAQTTVAMAGLKSAKTSLGKAIIKSPIDGIVLARTVEVGQTVTAGFQTPILFTLARDLTEMQLEIDVDEADVGTVHEGQPATFVVDAYPKRVFRSKLLKLGNLPKTGTTVVTYQATLSVENPERVLKPGMTATATIVTSEVKDVLSVPNSALRFVPPVAASAAKPGPGLGVPGLGAPMRGMGGGRRPGGAGPAGSAGAGRPMQRAARQTVYVVKEGALVPVSVEVGASDGQRTEIKGDKLAQGTQVVLDVSEATP
ncbi:MAG TPA: efflux RND transporter periplasmic adaptor subunit [Polyangiaceae bacterium]